MQGALPACWKSKRIELIANKRVVPDGWPGRIGPDLIGATQHAMLVRRSRSKGHTC